MSVKQVERKESSLILKGGELLDFGIGAAGLVEFAALAVDEDGVRSRFEDRIGHSDAGRREMECRSHERFLVFSLLVPHAVERAHSCADVHLVDRRIEAHPRVALCERTGIFGERGRDFRVLEVSEPMGNPEVAQVDDRLGAIGLEVRHGLVDQLPVVAARSIMDEVQRRTVAKVRNADLPSQLEIPLPEVVMLHVYTAPGRDIPTTQPGDRWFLVNGSSYAAAHVSGLVALLRQKRRSPGPTLVSGRNGAIDACASLVRVTGACDCSCSHARVASLAR